MSEEKEEFISGLKKARIGFVEAPLSGLYRSGFSRDEKRECSQCGYVGFVQDPEFDPDSLVDPVPDYINLIWYSKRFKREVCLNCNAPGWKLALLGQKPKKLQELAKMSARERKALRRKGYQK